MEIRAGPFSAAEIESLFAQGKILVGDRIRQSGSREWIDAEAFSTPDQTDPPPPESAPAVGRLPGLLRARSREFFDGMGRLAIMAVVAVLLWQIDYHEIVGLPTLRELAVSIGTHASWPQAPLRHDDLIVDFGPGLGLLSSRQYRRQKER